MTDRYDQYRQQWDYASKGNITPAPTHVDIELSSACNTRCPMCPQSEDNKRFKTGLMETMLAKRILIEAKAAGVCSIKFNWRGESTLHPDFCEIIRFAKELDFVDLMLNTNGSFLSRDILHSVLELDTVAVSIDTLYQDKAAVLRPGLHLPVVINNLNYLINARDADRQAPARLKVNFTIQKENEDELPAMKEYCRDLNIELFAKPEFPRVKMLSGNHKRKNCGFPFQRLTIDYEGNVYPCCVPWDGLASGISLGSLTKESLMGIWQGAKMAEIRQAVITQEYKYSACLNCLSWASYVRGGND